MKMRRLVLIFLLCPVLPLQPGLAQSTMVPVVTRAYDNARSGWNQKETVLTQDNVRQKGIRRITIIPVYGDARGMEAQPLILPAVRMPDGSTHDVMVLPSMANVVRGVDATTGAGLWSVTLGRPVQGSAAIDFHQINDKWGVLSTGVVDPATKRAYLVAWISPDGTPARARHYVCVLDVATGKRVVAPVLVTGTSGGQSYNSVLRKQRSSLLLTNVQGRKTIFWASGTVMETGAGAAGWIFAFDCASNKITASLAMSQGRGAGIWMGGQGLAADSKGYLYGVTGNGSFDGVRDFGESIVKVRYTPPAASAASLTVVSWWSPYSDAGRTGQAGAREMEQKLSGVSAPSEAVRPVGAGMNVSLANARVVMQQNAQGKPVKLIYPRLANNGAWNDEDLGSAGGALMEKYGIYVASGKDGIAYPTKIANMGNTLPADFADAHANCGKLAGPPVWLTESPGPVDPCPQDPTTLNFMPWGRTRHMHMTPVQYLSPTHGQMIFAWGENSQLHAWGVSSTGALTYLAQGNEFASANVTNPPGGMPGGFCTLSSHGNQAGTALLWCTIPYGDANATVTTGRLLVYDPDHFITNPDGSHTLAVLWDSQRWNISFLLNKFSPPVVDGGQIYVPNYNGGVDVYGLAPWETPLCRSSPTGTQFSAIGGPSGKRETMFTINPIGVVRSPYRDTKAIPKGVGTKHDAEGILDINPELEVGLTDIEGFSHLFVLWIFDRSEGCDLLVTPPGETRTHGLFATRSPRRPNPMGLTVVEVLGREGPRVRVRGVDMLDGTPIVDIKPYMSSIPQEKLRRGWLAEAEARQR